MSILVSVHIERSGKLCLFDHPSYYRLFKKMYEKQKATLKWLLKWSSVGSGLLPSELPDSQN